ncbi:hypothetical protein B1H10_04810 [candidate division KSB1 bacterium 4484_188]|nr:MAG: hypothetical protein B1H10_04810 [candidate division KSB1 bacterium 4484_188]
MHKTNPFDDLYEMLRRDRPAAQKNADSLLALNKNRLQALYLVSQQLNTILDPDRLFEEVIRQITGLLKAEHAVIIMRENNRLKIRISHNIDDQSEQNALKFSRSVVSEVMNEYKPLYSTNALDDSRFSMFQTIQELEILSFICVPILVKGDAIGTIYVDNRHLTNVFTEADVEFLQVFANLLGIAVRNSLAYRQVEELNRSLEQKVKERTRELRRTIAELKETQAQLIRTEKMAGLGRLIAGFMHEFNNPINFIYSNLPHLEEYSRKLLKALNTSLANLPESLRESLENELELDYIRTDLMKLIDSIREGAQRSREIVEDLKNFAGSTASGKVVFNWNENLENVGRMFRKRVSQKVMLEIDSEDTFSIEGNKAELNQALLNLFHNAADAGASRITVTNRQDKGRLLCEISDNGCGIPEKDLPNIFDPFFTTKQVGKGMGLGLSIVYSSITHHGGQIEVSSEENRGTTFCIRLPLAGHPER